ncbi:MAG: FAD-dependent oxidoreductase [bacterium]|nr:FAD-dependent oxidoreductase [bacterium]
MGSDYPLTFSPITIRGVTYKNRLHMAPQSPGLTSRDGMVTTEMIDFWRPAARGGVGIITVGNAPVDFAEAKDENRHIDLGADENVVPLSRFVDMCEGYGCHPSIEINHSGFNAVYEYTHRPPVSSSEWLTDGMIRMAKRNGRDPIPSIPMTVEKIREVEGKYIAAAKRCQTAGFKMALIHGAHANLIGQFSSPHFNKRTDEYGGSLENRARFAMEILDGVRAACGEDFVIEFRVSADEFIEGGMHFEETKEYLKMLQDKIDIVHVSAGILGPVDKMRYWHQSTYMDYMYNVHFAADLRNMLPDKVKVCTVGSIMNIDNAERILANGDADFIAMARPFVADPEMPRKFATGRKEDFRPCMRCDWCAARITATPKTTACAANPMVMHYLELRDGKVPKAEEPKCVGVIGGGPAGMQAAITLRERGHEVVLFEKEPRLGGNMRYAAASSIKADVRAFCDYMVRQVEKSGAELRLGVEATKEMIDAEGFDGLVIAVGSEPILPSFDGAGKPGSPEVVWGGDVELGDVEVGKRALIVGAGTVGMETALTLLRAGHEVTIVEMAPNNDALCSGFGGINNNLLRELCIDGGASFSFNMKLSRIVKGGIECESVESGEAVRFEGDTVILAMGMKPRRALAESFVHCAPETEVRIVGDAMEALKIGDATNAAFSAALHIC